VGAGVRAAEGPVVKEAQPALPRVRRRRKLGSTGLEVSDIGIGMGYLDDPAVLAYALDRGINLLDTAEAYLDGRSEATIGKLRLPPSRRDELVIVTKLGLGPEHTREKNIARARACLKRLGTDRIDLLLLHAVRTTGVIRAERWVSAVEELKRAGDVRHVGLSSHENIAAVVEAGLALDLYEVFLVAYNFMQHGELDEVLARAAAKGRGIIAMKTLAGALHRSVPGLKQGPEAFPPAALRWTLDQPSIQAAVISMKHFEHVNQYLRASGGGATAADREILAAYRRALGSAYCRPGCTRCLAACPHQVPIPEILRFVTYARGYGEERAAMRHYAALPPERRADRCRTCAAPCREACRHGIPIPRALRAAHETLTLELA
jgi:hypothetical protein